MTLEEQLREAAARGLTHLTVYPVPSEDGKTTYWAARATPSIRHGYVSTSTLDIVEAMSTCLAALPKAKAREQKEKVTGAVTAENALDKWSKP
jgi:hypothetical protein